MTSNSLPEKASARPFARDLLSADMDWPVSSSLESDVESLKDAIGQHFSHTLGREANSAAGHYLYQAVAMTIRDRLMGNWRATRAATVAPGVRRTCYLSLEYLIGRSLCNAVHNIDLAEPVQQALHELGMELEEVQELETDAGLGNGGLGRLAACFMDSCATLALPVTGYGLRYRYGMFRQELENGYQIEKPDNWLRDGYVWELERPEYICRVCFGGSVRVDTGKDGKQSRRWVHADEILAIPYDVPVPGHGNGVVNTLRLWSAAATDEFNLSEFNSGGYSEAVSEKNAAENITMVLYPNDSSENGKILRLRQQYFLVSASLQDTVRLWFEAHTDLSGFAAAHCFQMNDTHPSLAVAELMRLLMDQHGLEWAEAWSITSSTMAYTNHTLLPEALECWSLAMLEALLPRPMEIIHEINRRFLLSVAQQWPEDEHKQAQMSIVSFDDQPIVRMAHLAIVGSFSINGVARLHSRLLQQGLFSNFYALWPKRFNNKTNGVTQRRWLAHSNPELRQLLDELIGGSWVTELNHLEKLLAHVDDPIVLARWRSIKLANKGRLVALVKQKTGLVVDPHMLFDIQVKRMHEYKRQFMCALHAVHCYLSIVDASQPQSAPRFVLIAGKAAPGYYMAKAIIKLINNVAEVINSDPVTAGKLRVVFLPDYNVSAMEIICPAADLSEQISTAGKEASGTGNMKFMMNGALTIGTLDGANVEILEAVGEENFFRFGLSVEGVDALQANYSPADIIAGDERLKAIVDAFDEGMFDGDDAPLVRSVVSAALSGDDPWMTIADLPDYLDAQARVSAAWMDGTQWSRMSMLNTANSGRFSTDRTMQDYNRDIWHLTPLKLPAQVESQ